MNCQPRLAAAAAAAVLLPVTQSVQKGSALKDSLAFSWENRT